MDAVFSQIHTRNEIRKKRHSIWSNTLLRSNIWYYNEMYALLWLQWISRNNKVDLDCITTKPCSENIETLFMELGCKQDTITPAVNFIGNHNFHPRPLSCWKPGQWPWVNTNCFCLFVLLFCFCFERLYWGVLSAIDSMLSFKSSFTKKANLMS